MGKLLDIVIRRVPLRKLSDYYYKGRCPWCSKNTFTVSDTQETFYCFTCGMDGNAESFVKKHTELMNLCRADRKERSNAFVLGSRERIKKFKEEVANQFGDKIVVP